MYFCIDVQVTNLAGRILRAFATATLTKRLETSIRRTTATRRMTIPNLASSSSNSSNNNTRATSTKTPQAEDLWMAVLAELTEAAPARKVIFVVFHSLIVIYDISSHLQHTFFMHLPHSKHLIQVLITPSFHIPHGVKSVIILIQNLQYNIPQEQTAFEHVSSFCIHTRFPLRNTEIVSILITFT